MTKKQIDLALKLAERGFRIFPQDRSKKPLIKDWPNVATNDQTQICGWADKYPNSNFEAISNFQNSNDRNIGF